MTNVEKYFDDAVLLYDNGDDGEIGAALDEFYNGLTDDEKKEIKRINGVAERYIIDVERAKFWDDYDEIEMLERKLDKFPNVVKQAIYLIDET